jgi:hypothetical protein
MRLFNVLEACSLSSLSAFPRRITSQNRHRRHHSPYSQGRDRLRLRCGGKRHRSGGASLIIGVVDRRDHGVGPRVGRDRGRTIVSKSDCKSGRIRGPRIGPDVVTTAAVFFPRFAGCIRPDEAAVKKEPWPGPQPRPGSPFR